LGGGITLKSANKPTQRGRATGAHLKPGPKLLRAKASGGRAGFGSKCEELDPVAAFSVIPPPKLFL